MTAFELAEDGRVVKEAFMLQTSIAGGNANQVTPSDFSDRWIARMDISTKGVVEIWEVADNHTSAKVVASLRIDDAQCCANAVWLY